MKFLVTFFSFWDCYWSDLVVILGGWDSKFGERDRVSKVLKTVGGDELELMWMDLWLKLVWLVINVLLPFLVMDDLDADLLVT